MGFPSYAADGSDTYKPPKKYTAAELRAIRDVARDGQNRYESKTNKPVTSDPPDTKYGPLINPSEAQQLIQLKEDNALDNLSKELETFGDSPTTKKIFGR
jgi:hypothetical protein